MFKYKTVQMRLIEEEQKNADLTAQLIEANARQAKTDADLEYVAMMTDVDLEEGDDEDEQEV